MEIRDRARYWGASAEERATTYPCYSYLDLPYEGWLRAIDIDAPTEHVFRWLCQLKLGTYSYDPFGTRRRRGLDRLTPGADQLERGQPFLVFEIVDFEPGRQISGITAPEMVRYYGPIALTYAVSPRDEGGSRLIVKVDVPARSLAARLRRALLVWGDLVMERKQLLTLKALAEQSADATGQTS
jgi:hypothetical protein